MSINRRTVVVVLVGAGALLFGAGRLVPGQERAPNRRDFSITAQDFRFSPNRLEVTQDDLVRLTVTSKDVAYSVTIDEYRLSRRVPAGGMASVEFRAATPGEFAFYSNLTNDPRHKDARGRIIVRAR